MPPRIDTESFGDGCRCEAKSKCAGLLCGCSLDARAPALGVARHALRSEALLLRLLVERLSAAHLGVARSRAVRATVVLPPVLKAHHPLIRPGRRHHAPPEELRHLPVELVISHVRIRRVHDAPALKQQRILPLDRQGRLVVALRIIDQELFDLRTASVERAVREGGELRAYGINGGPLKIVSVEQLANAVKERGLASTLYVISLLPQIAGAPALPLLVDANDNAFTRADVHRITLMVLKHMASRGLAGRCVFGVSDGDGRLRWLKSAPLLNHSEPD